MKNFKLLNNLAGWASFAIAAVVYLLTIEPTASFWDCGEFITTAFKLEVGHPPGAPFFMILGRFFTLFADTGNAAKMINALSALSSAFTIMFLCWTITHIARKIISTEKEISTGQGITILGSGIVGALAYTFSDTFWFSAVEGEVYATSSLFTAIVFWAILKWENEADKPFANRWIIFIAYIIGLSLGVHLLNLLAIPAIVFVYYFKKYQPSRKGFIYSFIVSIVLLAIIMYVVIPGFVKIGSWFELLFVNSFGLPYHSGVIFYIVTVIAAVIYGIRYTIKKQKVVWNTILVGLTVILLGYSTFTLIIIRSSAKPPMDQNSPNDTFTLLSYLNREQYGDRPLFYGQYYNAPLDAQNRYTEGKPVYSQVDGKYVITDIKVEPNYDDRFTTIFPRMWSSVESVHAEDYQQWGKIEGRNIRITNDYGETETRAVPKFSENLRFFFRYQLGHMYFRYFMWNFVGRQDDIQSHGGVINGNWLSGIKFIDEWRLGDQDGLPAMSKNNKARNTYFFLPLLLGILGIAYQNKRGREGKQSLWIVFLLFLLTGIAIVVYLNQYPHQPRERDYAFAGSFYAFSIWIGLGVLGLYEWIKRYLPELMSALIVTIVSLILVPGIMGIQNWDDHDRSNRYTARDFGANYLKTCAGNAVIFTNGDNDTFPLWYNQEVEGVRTDVRVCNLSYLQTDWYISQMKIKAYESDPLPISMNENQYRQGTRDLVYLLDDSRISRDYVDLKEAIDFIKSDNPSTKLQQAENAAFLPKKILKFKIDKEAVIKNNVVKPEDYDKIVDTITIDFSNKTYIPKDEMIVLDMLATNNWERPIYYSITVGSSKYMGFEDYFQNEGFAYRLVPIKSENPNDGINYGTVETDIMYTNLMENFEWGNMNDPSVYIDENNARMMTNIRNSFNRLAGALIEEGKIDSAELVIDKCLELVPHEVVPYEYFAIELAENLYKMDEQVKADKIIKKAFDYYCEHLDYYFSLNTNLIQTASVNEEIQRNLFYMQKSERACSNNGNTELSEEVTNAFEEYYALFLNSVQ